MRISPRIADIYSGWAEEYYNPDLTYHNWGHAEEVIDESLQLLNRNGRWTRHVNRPLLQVAAAWHDAGHDHDERFAFESPTTGADAAPSDTAKISTGAIFAPFETGAARSPPAASTPA